MLPRLRMVWVKKRFGATQALKGVSLELLPGEVHALIGENGAGKSTLMKILSAACQPDDGRMEIDSLEYYPRNPREASRSGVAMIYQELNLAPDLTVAENICLGAEPRRFGFVQARSRDDLARQTLAELGNSEIPLHAPVRSCTIAEQQVVEIARALAGNPKIIVMDEPTSSLTQKDAQRLFEVIRRLKSKNVSVIYISHFLEECQQVADCYTVLRDGETVKSGSMAGTNLSEIVSAMAGKNIGTIYPTRTCTAGEPVLRVQNLAGSKKPRDISFELRSGEILGLAGLIGAGRTETVRAIFGLDRFPAGTVSVFGREDNWAPAVHRLKQGLGLLSENRKEEGLLLNRSITENLTLSAPVSRAGFVGAKREHSAAAELMAALKVKAAGPRQRIGELSGGNQQKIAIARLLHQNAKILLLDEPTRGIDMGSKAQIYELLAQLAEQGKSILFISSYFPELLGICDRVGVVCRGEVAAIKPASDWTEHSLIAAAVGTK